MTKPKFVSPLTAAEESQLRASMYQVWSVIGFDMLEVDPEASAFDAAVVCVDADRILEFANDVQSNDIVKRAAREGWLTDLLKHIAHIDPFC